LKKLNIFVYMISDQWIFLLKKKVITINVRENIVSGYLAKNPFPK